MNTKAIAALFLSAISTSAYSQTAHDSDNIAECKFAPYGAPPGTVPTIPLDWQFNPELMGIFGPGKVRVFDPGNLLSGREITRITFKGSNLYFAVTQSPAYAVDDSAMLIGMLTTPLKSGARTSFISSIAGDKQVPKFMGHCVILPFKHGSDKWFDTLLKTDRPERGE